MSSLRRSIVSLLISVAVFALIFSPSVNTESDNSSVIRLPTDNPDSTSYGDYLCPGTATPASCPVKCFRTDPVCGADGVTYWCGCADALCAGARVAKLGFCEIGNGGSGSLSGQAFLLVHIVWLILLGIFVLFGLL